MALHLLSSRTTRTHLLRLPVYTHQTLCLLIKRSLERDDNELEVRSRLLANVSSHFCDVLAVERSVHFIEDKEGRRAEHGDAE